MYQFETKIRVRYAETDQMGFVYYGHYFTYFEVARVESLRAMGYAYKELEAEGIMLPVLEQHIKYHLPATYDELLTIKACIKQMPSVRMVFEYECFNEKEELINTAETVLVFMNKKTGKPTRPPQRMIELLEPFFTT
ncbi:MAG: thioesterase family protein [Bacteroidetes bacterium]|nr:thioesterase family protein [Bacteroidota bacterium]MCZ6693685.1 thioesterase family protein [Bacteroidota bacterium]MCZ6900477.1 thioesterase family protein [Bacteroidota bacterium]